MSCDYGMKCIKCGKEWVWDGVREDDARDFVSDIHDLASLSVLRVKMKTHVNVSFDFPGSNHTLVDSLLDFASEHHSHELVVIDEYGYVVE